MGERISRDDVQHVAKLARLAVTDAEADLLTEQLAAVLGQAAALAALDTTGAPLVVDAAPLLNVLRDDVAGPSLDHDVVLAEAPAAEDGRFKVPPILAGDA